MIYLDTSVIVAYYCPEALSLQVQDLLREQAKPGLTGWAQVNGRNALSWEDKFALDVWYVDNWSLKLDLKIIGMTILSVLRREEISQEGQATMEEFMGTNQSSEI